MKDLVCLAADKCIEAVLRGLLSSRSEALRIRALDWDGFVHPRRDPGCYNEGHEFLRGFHGSYEHGLLVFDRDWEGAPFHDVARLEEDVRGRFAIVGLADWAEVVVVAPEIEAWVWSDSPHVQRALGWEADQPLRQWLEEKGAWAIGQPKPADPKNALQQALQHVHQPLSSSMFGHIGRTVSVERCTDPAFTRLKNVLTTWFGV
jgi:hypothetical protein